MRQYTMVYYYIIYVNIYMYVYTHTFKYTHTHICVYIFKFTYMGKKLIMENIHINSDPKNFTREK